jgi:hypothetical protein
MVGGWGCKRAERGFLEGFCRMDVPIESVAFQDITVVARG